MASSPINLVCSRRTLRFTMCHFSLVTTPAEKLDYLQRIPHVDSVLGNELAMIHYLFSRDLGGTAFYRHRSTGFEYVDEARRARYLACLEEDKKGPDSPEARYINGSTALYEQLGSQRGVFNRLLMYRRTTLHSGNIAPDFVPDPDPRTGFMIYVPLDADFFCAEPSQSRAGCHQSRNGSRHCEGCACCRPAAASASRCRLPLRRLRRSDTTLPYSPLRA